MSMSALVRALGAAAGGVSKGMDEAEAAAERKRKREQDAEDRTYLMSERARTTAERDRADKLRVDMGAASAPVNVEQVQPAGPVMDGAEGTAGQAIPMVSRVQGKSFETPDAAAAAATAANDPQAVAARQAQVAAAAGDPHAAQQLRTGAMQEKAAKLQLSGAERVELDAQFNADLQSKVNSWETLDKFISDSAGDGQGGAVKYTSVPSPDGKTRVLNRIGPDGAMVPTGQAFPNTADGLQLAMGELAKLPPEKKLMHLHQKEQTRIAAEKQRTDAVYQDGMLKNAADKTAASIEIAAAKLDAAQARAGAAAAAKAAAGGMTMADLKDGHNGIAKTLNKDWETQISAETDPVKLKAIKVAREAEIATVQRLYTGAMSAGFALTPEQAIVAFRSGETATQTFKSKSGDGTVKVEGVMYGGRFIPMADNPGAAMAPKPAAVPIAKPAAGGAATPAAPAAGPDKPGMVDRIVGAAKGALADGAETGRQMEAIRARVLEAGKGGAPLTAAERAQAKKYGMTPTS